MQEQKNYVLHSIKTLLNLQQAPYELTSSSALDKFVSTPEQEVLTIAALPTKEFKIIGAGSAAPKEGTIITITKFKIDSPLQNFYNFNLRPAQGLRQLACNITNLYEPIALRTKNAAVVQVKELKAVLESQLKNKFTGQNDVSFTCFQEEFDFWQEQDIEGASARCSFFLKEYAAISKSWRNSHGGVELSRLSTLIETTWQIMFNIWNSPHDYSEKRFLRLAEVFECEVKNSIRMAFAKDSDLLEPTFDIRQMIVESIQCCGKFISLLAYHNECARRKPPTIKTKIVEQLREKIMGTYRTKSKVQFLLRLFNDKLISQDPASLMFLVKAQNFMSSFVSQFKNNPKAEQKLEKEKEKLNKLTVTALPLFEGQLKECMDKPNIQYLLKALQKWYYFLSEPQFSQNTIEYQDASLKKSVEYLEKYLSEQMKLMDGKSSEPEKLRVVRAVIKRFDQINSLMNQFAQSSTSMPAYRKRYDKAYEQLKANDVSQCKAFITRYQTLLLSKIDGTKITGRVIAQLSISDKGMEYSTGGECRKFIEEMSCMIEMGYTARLGDKLLKALQEAKRFNKQNSFIGSIRSRYNWLEGRLQFFQKHMLQKELKQIKDIVENPKIKKKLGPTSYEWKDVEEVNDYIAHLNATVDRMTNYLKLFNASELEIEQISIELLSISFHPNNFFVISQKLDQIGRIMEVAGSGRDSAVWKDYWRTKLTQVVEVMWQQALLKGIDIPMTVRTVLVGKKCAYDPELYEVKQKYYRELKHFIGWPLQQKSLDGSALMRSSSQLIVDIYSKTEQSFEGLEGGLAKYVGFEKMIGLDLDYIEDKMNREQFSSEQLASVLSELKECKQKVEEIKQEEKQGGFVVNNSTLKEHLTDLLNQNIDGIIQLIKFSIKLQSEQVEEYISSVMSKLESKPKNMQEMAVAMQDFEKIRLNEKDILQKISSIEAKNVNIRSIAGTSFNTANMLKRWENLQIASVEMNNILEEQRNRIQEDTVRKSESLEHEANRLYKKYQQINPKSQELSREQVLQVYGKIKDWRLEWQDVEQKYAAIRSDISHFAMKMPEFKLYVSIKTKLEVQLGNWLFFMEYRGQVQKMEKEEWLTFRGTLNKYQDLINDAISRSKALVNFDQVAKFIRDVLEDNRQGVALLRCMTGENFQKEHWGMLFSILRIKHVTSSDKLTFGDLLQSDILSKANEIRELQAQSRGQMNIRVAIDDLQAWSITREFQLTDYNSMGRVTSLIKEWKDVMTQVSDHQALVASIKDNKYSTRFKGEIQKYEMKLSILDASLLKLNQIQRKWIYLQPIFMRGALPEQQGRWKRLDEDYRNIMNNIANNHHVIELAHIAGFLDTLTTIMAQLERCQKALNDYLQEKRNKFPRFYFLGDDDMLEILGQSQNPTIIQLHLKKLFSGIHSVFFADNHEKILAMRSHLKEEVRFSQEIEVSDVVENWLDDLNKNMVTTLRLSNKNIKSTQIEESFNTFCSQIICLFNELTFHAKCSSAIKAGKSSLQSLRKEEQALLAALTKKCHLTKEELILAKIKSLILDVIHHIAVIDLLMSKNTTSIHDWNWHKQLKFVEESNGAIKLNMANSSFNYTFQYQGNAQKLVYTPLTDKCYLTLTQAMHMGLGGNPYGPAGTGKTESVKALALAFGRQVLVFNCDQGLDFQSMGRIFIGLVKCGAWGCFDEFNRLLQEQLSAISQQIQIIQQAIKAREQIINLLGKRVEVNFNSGIFVTLNPAGKGYGGRSKLPDNLKQLFRPVAMSIPDNELIAEVLLFSEGFKTAKVLSQKIITIFTLSKQLLSRQLHYDWGLRALKTILTVAGRLVFEEQVGINDSIESEILIKAMRINTISKLTFNDMLKFNVLVQDVFPGTNIKDIIYEQISQAVRKVFEEENFEMLPNQLNKILQFYEATKQRIGAVLVGPSGCGKTTIWKTLKKAYEKLSQPVKIHLINPKAMPRSSFLGYMNNDTREFSEGVLTVSAREVLKEEHTTLNWIICDGDVDPEWIEALNSVLDDNHLLTLPTGERISFGSNVNFIFETDNLQFASPATVSRMGMIYMNDEDININSIIMKWTKKLKPQQVFINQQISFIEEMCDKTWKLADQQLVATTKVGLVRNALSLIEDSTNEQEFRLNLVKGLASNFQASTRGVIFESIFNKPVPGGRDPMSLRINNGKIGEYKDSEASGIQRIYATKQIKKDIQIVSHWLKSGHHLIIVGKQGCGKSLLLEASIQELQKSQKCKTVTIHCNRETKASILIQKLYQTCQKASSANGKVLRPQNCNRQIVILKQVNLPKPDKYNTIQLITFLQSLIVHEGFYDHNLQFIKIGEGIQFVCIIKPASTIGRFQITTRFVSNLRVLAIDYGSVGARQKLDLLTPHAQDIDGRLHAFWECVQKNFKPDDNAHYLFCPRNLNSMIDSLEHYDIDLKKLEDVLMALRNEATKQFEDRLVDHESKLKFRKLMEPIFGSNKNDAIFTVVQGKLKPVVRQGYLQIVTKAIKNYESDVKEVNIILVDEVVNLMSSLERKIIEGGALLLAGMSGNLRKTTLRIMAHKNKIPIYTLSNLRNPSLKQFYKDLKAALEVAAGHNKKIILFLEQHQLGKNEFYEKINSLISSGQISGLFSSDEIESITEDVDTLRSEYYGKNLYQSFIERIKKNVIVVLSLDHRNKEFYEICSANPAFYSFCRIIWQNCYSKQSMTVLFNQRVKHLNLKEVKEINQAIGSIHKGSSHKFMKLINNFLTIFEKTQSKSGNKLQKLALGLKKLVQTAKMVDFLTGQAISKKKLLTIKQKEADESLNYITDAMEQASSSKAEAQKLQVYLEVEEKKIQRDRKIVMAQLQKVLPLIEEAKVAVSGLTPKSIQQIRSFVNPPEAVRYVLKAVLALFGNRDDSWNSMKNFLKVCKDQILVFDIREVSEKVRNDVQSIISEHAYFFQRQNVFKASQDAVPLADWVKAAVEYSKTYEKVRPLEQNLNKIEKELSRSKIRYKECTEKVAESQQKIKELNENFVKKTNEAEVLKQQLKKAQTAQASGQELLSKLQDEKVRWGVQSDKLKVEVEMMPKYTVLTSCFVTYLSESPENIRHLEVEKWKKILGCHYYNFLPFVTSQAITLQQIMKGLPNDQLSIENSQILGFLKQIPVIIDPHTQATTWLKQKLQADNKIQILTQQDPKFINTLELSIRFGKTLIIQEIDYIEPILTSILKGDFQRQGARNLIEIGEKSLDVNQTFKLYLTTRNSSIQIAKHQKDLVSIVNFSVTKSGLEGKLLSIIITYFQPQIEQQKQDLLQEQQKFKVQLSNLEEKLLKELADSSGDILENKGLINSLNQTKAHSIVVGKSLKDSQKLQKTLDEKREVYQIIAEIGAKLYISLSILKNLNPMYKFNLSQFIGLFQQSLLRGKGKGENQITTIQEALIQIVFNNISVCLIKSHRLLLGLIFVREIFENSITEDEFNVLVGNIVSTQNVQLPAWMDDKDKENYKIFQSVAKTKENLNSAPWKDWYNSYECEDHVPKDTSLTYFQTCLLTNVCRPDRLTNILTNFVLTTLKLPNLSGLQSNMKILTEQKMKNTVPCLFIVSIGFDPSKEIQQYATKVVGKQRFQQLSMGGDQNDYALQLLREAAKQGKWLCLKNLHLVINFVSILQKQVLSMESHQNFRLFLTTEAHQKFAPILLQTCYKVSYEAPPGIKQNFTRLLGGQALNKEKKLEFVATYFHALIQQRRNYIPQGWNKFYEFNYGDYKSGLNIIKEVSSGPSKDWEMLYGLMVDTIYGGRIDNEVDKKLLDVYLHLFFNEAIETGKQPIYKDVRIQQLDQLIQKLPNIDNPELYNLPMGIDKAILRIKAKELIQNLKIATLSLDSSTKFSRDSWSKILSPLFTLWKGLQKLVDQKTLKKIGEEKLKSVDPIQSFVFSQYNEAIINFISIRSALQKLEGVLFGNQILTTEIEDLGKIIIKGETPSKWRKIWEGPDLISEWLKLFVKKLNNLVRWKDLTESNKLLFEELDLSQVYRPEIFLNALKQRVGREKRIPINQLKIKSSFSKPSQICVKMKNLILQGCSFSVDHICQAKNDHEYEEIPVFYVSFNEKEAGGSDYLLPFYTDMTRGTLLSMLPVAFSGSNDKLVLGSAALLLKDI